jgi:hypothetical protein
MPSLPLGPNVRPSNPVVATVTHNHLSIAILHSRGNRIRHGKIIPSGSSSSEFSHDLGHGTTFAANHLAHYLLLHLLMPRLAYGATAVITTSSLHDPETNPVAPSCR